jgi:hypothetical protein
LGARAFLYDAALAACAFTVSGHYERAVSILRTLGNLYREHDQLWFSYETDGPWPTGGSSGTAVVRSGAVAWVGYAATFYLRLTAERAESMPDEALRGDLLALARRSAEFLLELRVGDPADKRHGLVTGGGGGYLPTDGGPGASELFQVGRVQWVSTEHNLDAYFLLRDMYLLTGAQQYADVAEGIASGIASMWSDRAAQLIQGMDGSGVADTQLPLDTASWGALFYSARDDEDRARTSLAAVDRRFAVRHGERRGFLPYAADKAVYADPERSVRHFGRVNATWGDVGPIWTEGSLGVAAAHARIGNENRAAGILEEMHAFQEPNGGIRYADREIPGIFTTHRSVAATAWYVLSAHILSDPEVRRVFWTGQ